MTAASLLERSAAARAFAARVPRRLVVTWQHPQERGIRPVGFLICDGESSYTFEYIRNALDVSGFRPLLGFPEFDRLYRSDVLFPLFSQRVMDARRPDYSRYVTQLGLPEDSKPWEQIARSGGKRSGDTLQLFPVPTVTDGRFSCAFLVHGIRHLGKHALHLATGDIWVTQDEVLRTLDHLQPGDALNLIPEPGNEVNPNALLVADSGDPIGYVPDLLVDDLAELREGQSASVEVVNGRDAPWHLRVLARLDGPLPEGFEFFSGDSWSSLAQ